MLLKRPMTKRRAAATAVLGMLVVLVAAGGVCRFTGVDCRICLITRGTCAPAPTTVPAGFREEVVVRGLDVPTAFAFVPGGRILVAEKVGVVRVVRDRRLVASPLLDLRERVNDHALRGLLTIEPDPAFAENGFLYALYTREDTVGGSASPKTMRLSRFAVSPRRGAESTERVLLGSQGRGSCNDLPPGADCIPADNVHCGGDLVFARDGTMFFSTGDGATGDKATRLVRSNSLRAQDLDSLAGKVLRVTPAGRGVRTNPFWNGDQRANRSKVWAYGLRNPFRMTLAPGDAVPYVGDVGWQSWDEIDVARRGANLGWPCYEGPAMQGEYSREELCRALYGRGRRAMLPPLAVHRPGSITGGTFYSGTAFPEEYRRAYFYGDWGRNTLHYVGIERTGRVGRAPRRFATNAPGPVQIETGPDGSLYYLASKVGELRRIVYAP